MYSKTIEQPASRKRVSAVSKDTNQATHVDGKVTMTFSIGNVTPGNEHSTSVKKVRIDSKKIKAAARVEPSVMTRSMRRSVRNTADTLLSSLITPFPMWNRVVVQQR